MFDDQNRMPEGRQSKDNGEDAGAGQRGIVVIELEVRGIGIRRHSVQRPGERHLDGVRALLLL